MDFDELLIFRGEDYTISEHIVIHQPTLNQICDFGEKKYFQMVSTLTSVGADLKWQLDEIGIDYTQVNDFELFYSLLIKEYTQEQTSIFFGDLDFSKFKLYTNTINGELCLVQYVKAKSSQNEFDTVIIDSYTYYLIADLLRKMHGFKKNEQLPANETTKRILIEDDKEEYIRNKNKEYHSQLLDLISAMVNCEGFKYNHNEVWNMKIYAFMNSVKRISKIKNSQLLLQSGYSGYGINLKDINDREIDWLGGLE